MTGPATLEAVELDQLLDFEHEPQCESAMCEAMGRGSHPADWLVRFSICGHAPYWCNDRFIKYSRLLREGKRIWCHRDNTHGQEVISWHRVREGTI